MKLGLKVKIAATAVALAGMFSGVSAASAGVMTGIGVQTINVGKEQIITQATKTTSDQCSDITLGDVTIYDCVQLQTWSEDGGKKFVESNPLTLCYGNSSTYMGQYITMNTYVGQQIQLRAQSISQASRAYTADFKSWDYH